MFKPGDKLLFTPFKGNEHNLGISVVVFVAGDDSCSNVVFPDGVERTCATSCLSRF